AQNAANTYANCIYSNTQQTITKTRNNCTIGGTGGSYNYIVLAGTQTSSISQDDANTLAINNNQTNAQNAANNYASCTFYNDTFSILKARNNCGNGYIFGYYRYFVAANLISSNISKSDANTVAYNTYQSAAQDAANLYGSCIACYGVNQKIVNSVCLTGIKQIISKTYNPKLDRTTVTYNYVFSDGTTSINYVEYLDGNQTGGGTDPGGNPIQQ
ncbi:MAG: DUF5977 domain-containing protein, partial [Sediminibacterium sp.]|nr:DUF5977 domain-containing protein [Sediminibacterium sp.]